MSFGGGTVIEQLQKFPMVQTKRKSRYMASFCGSYSISYLGIAINNVRNLAKSVFRYIELSEVETLLKAPVFEHRLLACLILVNKFQKSRSKEARMQYIQFVFKQKEELCCLELVELIGSGMFGHYLFQIDSNGMEELVKSDKMVDQLLSIFSLKYFVKNGHTNDAFYVVEYFAGNKDKNIQKAIGILLREIGKCEPLQLKTFVQNNRDSISRIALNFALRGFNPD